MRKNLTKWRIITYLLYFILACTLVLGVTYARYSTTVTGTAIAKTASVALGGEITLNNVLTDLVPGDSKDITFTVNNQDTSAKASEVTQDYSIIIKTTDNLPLIFALKGNAGGTENNGNLANISPSQLVADGVYTWSGGTLPHSDRVEHSYTLTVSWPLNSGDAELADEIDQITLTVDAKQAAVN